MTLAKTTIAARHPSRRAILLFAGLLALMPIAAHGQEPVKVRLGVLGGNPVAALLANERGYFADANLEIELVQLNSGPAAIAATTSGSVDISFGDLFAWSAGLSNNFTNVTLIAPAASRSKGSLLVASNGAIKQPSDLAGKRIGAPGAPLFSTVTKLWLANNGVDPSSVSFVIIPPGSEGTALASNSVDAIYAYNDLVALSVKASVEASVIGVPTDQIPLEATTTAYYANAAFIAANPAAVEAFVKALRHGGADYLAATDQDKAALFAKYNNLNFEELLAKYPNFFDEFNSTPVQTGVIDPAATQQWVDTGFKLGAFPKAVDIAPYIHATALTASE